MWVIIVTLILVVAGIGLIIGGSREGSGPLILGGIAALIVGAGILIYNCTVIIPTKQVGIPVTYGRPGEPMKNGFHTKAPWTDVVIMDATTQSVDNDGEHPTKAKDADDSDVFVHNLVRWSIQEGAADSLYRDYKDFEALPGALVQPEIQTAVASVMQDYRPLEENQPNNDELSNSIKDRLQKRVGDRIKVESVSVTFVDVSDETKGRINALNAERANTRIAQQKAATAEQEANANRVLAASVSNDPNVVVANCLKMVEEAAPGKLPAGFNCWPGGNGAVVVPGR